MLCAREVGWISVRFALLVVLSACSFARGSLSEPAPVIDGGNSSPNADGAPGGPTDAAPIAPSDAAPTCSDGVRNGSELDIDCGGPACAPCTNVFASDNDTLAIFELNGSLADTSGNGRNATSIGGTFVATAWGMGLSVPGSGTQGFHWNAFAQLLVHPYTVELVVTAQAVGCWKKLFGPTDSGDAGWYYCTKFQSYPTAGFGPDLAANQRYYLAIVSTSATQIRAYVDGADIGTSSNFTAPPASAIFFRDDTNTNRSEALAGVIDAVRISRVARTAAAISAVQARLASQP